MATHYTLSKKQLPAGVITHYCPYCYKKKRKELKNTKRDPANELDTLTYIKGLVIYVLKNGEKRKYIDEFWTCPHCQKRIDDKDFLKSYCVTPEMNITQMKT